MADYGKKLAQLAAHDEGRALAAAEKLVKELKDRGELKQLPGILRSARKESARQRSLAPVVEVGRAEDADAALRAASEAGINAVRAAVNPTLIRGWRARAAGVLVDRSGKRALVDLYRRVTR
ncbi:MAG TPA: hypothetical protein VF439_00020 [Candidatus Paceibacterota bacterium]